MNDRITAILDFWIGPAATDPNEVSRRSRLWYQSGADGDENIRSLFGDDLIAAEAGELDDWSQTAEGSLALVILLDQFSRNIYRGTEAAFKNDRKALDVALSAIARSQYHELSPIGMVFLLHPLHHAEQLDAHEQCVSFYESLRDSLAESWHTVLDNFLHYAREHRDVIARFGRFPHRNAVLGRTSTEEEIRYLDGGGSRYGQ